MKYNQDYLSVAGSMGKHGGSVVERHTHTPNVPSLIPDLGTMLCS